MAAAVFAHYVVGDLTLGKPDLVEFLETETVEAAVRAVADRSEGAIAVWRRRDGNLPKIPERGPYGTSRFVGMINSLDLVAFMARIGDTEKALQAPVADVVTPDDSLVCEVDPGTRLIDALEMMKQGVRHLLVRKTVPWLGMSKRFSVVFNGRWLKNCESTAGAPSTTASSFCYLTREDVTRFLLTCLGALAPLPLTSITDLDAISLDYAFVNAAGPVVHVAHNVPPDPCAVAVVETTSDGAFKLVGEISAFKLWRADLVAASWAMARLSAAQFVSGFEDIATTATVVAPPSLPLLGATARNRKFSSQRVVGTTAVVTMPGMYRGRGRPLTCRPSSSLAAVMAQMLSHRATHVWVTELVADGADGEDDEGDEVLVGVVSYVDILRAVTRGYADE